MQPLRTLLMQPAFIGRGLQFLTEAYADARRPCAQPRTQFVNPSTPIGSQGPFQAGGQAPNFHQVTKSWQSEFNGILGHPMLLYKLHFTYWMHDMLLIFH